VSVGRAEQDVAAGRPGRGFVGLVAQGPVIGAGAYRGVSGGAAGEFVGARAGKVRVKTGMKGLVKVRAVPRRRPQCCRPCRGDRWPGRAGGDDLVMASLLVIRLRCRTYATTGLGCGGTPGEVRGVHTSGARCLHRPHRSVKRLSLYEPQFELLRWRTRAALIRSVVRVVLHRSCRRQAGMSSGVAMACSPRAGPHPRVGTVAGLPACRPYRGTRLRGSPGDPPVSGIAATISPRASGAPAAARTSTPIFRRPVDRNAGRPPSPPVPATACGGGPATPPAGRGRRTSPRHGADRPADAHSALCVRLVLWPDRFTGSPLPHAAPRRGRYPHRSAARHLAALPNRASTTKYDLRSGALSEANGGTSQAPGPGRRWAAGEAGVRNGSAGDGWRPRGRAGAEGARWHDPPHGGGRAGGPLACKDAFTVLRAGGTVRSCGTPPNARLSGVSTVAFHRSPVRSAIDTPLSPA
jgi:hypothetical protein